MTGHAIAAIPGLAMDGILAGVVIGLMATGAILGNAGVPAPVVTIDATGRLVATLSGKTV